MKTKQSLSLILLILVFLIFSSKSLHLHDASSDYINYLKGQQEDLKNQIQQLQQKIRSNKKEVQQQEDINRKIQLLQANIRSQRLLLSDMALSIVNQQLSNSQWNCPVISPDQKSIIFADIDSIKKNVNDIDNTLSPLQPKQGDGIKQVLQQTKHINLIGDDLKNALDSNGNQVPSSQLNQIVKTNLNAQNWILDQKKISDLNQQYKDAAQKGQLKLCPLKTPFYSNNNCISCSQQKIYFSLSKSQCVYCQNYKRQEHKCLDDQASKTNYKAVPDQVIIPPGKTIQDYQNSDKNSIICSKQKPFYNGLNCVNCPKYFDVQSKQCKQCNGNFVYSTKDHTCSPLTKLVINLEGRKNQLIIPQNKTFDQVQNQVKKQVDQFGVKQCPADRPFFNDIQCISCSSTLYFSMQTKSCGTCPSLANFNLQTNHCQQTKYFNNLNDPNWASKTPYQDIVKDIQKKKQDPLYKQCPVEKPYSVGNSCISCDSTQHFNYDLRKCANCYNGQVFSKNFHNCTYKVQNYQTNPQTAPNLIFEGHPKNEWIHIYYQNIEQNQNVSDCPANAPHYDGVSCLKCGQDHPYFNLGFKMCQKCQQNTSYSSDHHECLTNKGNIASQMPTLQKMAAGIFA